MNEGFKSEETIFAAALELLPAQRAAFLDEACAGNIQLRQAVQALLKSHAEATSFLENPPADVILTRAAMHSVSATEKIGDNIGHYKLLQQIGEGGCGIVYMAEQQEPVRRQVALKIIKLGMDTKQVIARFEAERQALALMDHPNIAKVFDAGATETGRPYFVMELVRGIKITDFCDKNELTTEERLKLFIQVCQAVQHAHQKGIIHRDLKPSNILVTLNDGVPLPKVIDFGIAKATQERLTDKTLFTAFEQFIGTPAYMSPEQAEMSAQGVDTRTDIYSLGVLLYELLTGRTPFESQKLLQAGVNEIRRIIREEEPQKPSTKLSTLLEGELTMTATLRQTKPPQLVHTVRGDLDWIVMKALEKDRNRRYETANGFARDVERYLKDEPTTACPPGRIYILRKTIRRHRFLFWSIAAVFFALLIGLVVALYLYGREKRANQRAHAAETAARTAAANSEQVAAFLEEMIEGAGPEAARGRDTTMMREILDQTEGHADVELKNQPEVEARLLMTVAGVYDQLDELAKAEALCQRAIQLQKSVSNTNTEISAQWVAHLAVVQTQRGEFAPAESSLRQALAIDHALGKEDTPDAVRNQLNLAELLLQRGNLPSAEKILRDVLARLNHSPEPPSPGKAQAQNDLGVVLWKCGNLPEAESSLQAALALWTNLVAPESPQMAVTLGNLGAVEWEHSELTNAEVTLRRSLAVKEKLFAGRPHSQIANTLDRLASVLRDRGKLDEAEMISRRAVTMETGLAGETNSNTAALRATLATILRRKSQAKNDADILREALRLNPEDALTADALAVALDDSLISIPPSTPWHYTTGPPDTNWTAPDYSDAKWPSAPLVAGFLDFCPRSTRATTPHTNLWLRQNFDLTNLPTGQLFFCVKRNHDAQIWINGIAAGDTSWSDADALVPSSTAAQAALHLGHNILAVYCEDADGGVPIEINLCTSLKTTSAHNFLLPTFSSWIVAEPNRAELYSGRANIFARGENWKEAASDLTKAISLDSSEPDYYFKLAALLLKSGQIARFNSLRISALTNFLSTADPNVAAQISILALLGSPDASSLSSAKKLADFAGDSAYRDGQLAWRQFAKGLSEFRGRRDTNAVAWLRETLVSCADKNLPGWNRGRQRHLEMATHAVWAMELCDLGDPIQAESELNKANELQKWKSGLVYADGGRDWMDSLVAQLLTQEARTFYQQTLGNKQNQGSK